jgi:nifR3 family TIM-barrel protein
MPSSPDHFDSLLAGSAPVLALAPMQDVTDLAFWGLMKRYGGADLYFTEFFRVHPDSCLHREILRSVDENPTGQPAIAQMIGNDIPSLVRSAKELMQHPVAGIDLNLGCPAPIVYKKCAGGGLLREPERIDRILGSLREVVTTKFTVKTRIGFDDERVFDELLPIFAKHSLDLLTVHGRTVLQMYRPGVRYDLIAQAAQAMNCPVIANGDIACAEDAARVITQTGVRGLMIGRGAIRNPWLFDQIRAHQRGEPFTLPTGREVLNYIRELFEAVTTSVTEIGQVNKMKKYMNYLGLGVPPADEFLHRIRRATTRAAFFAACEEFLDHDQPMMLVPVSAATLDDS